MKNKKYYLLATLPIILAAMMWLLSFTFELIRAPSDSAVIYGFLLLSGVFLASIILIVYIKNNFFNLFNLKLWDPDLN